MHCPFCRHADTQVVDSRVSEDGATIRRRRRCPACDKRFTTYERVELALPSVVKKDGSRTEFDRRKIVASMQLALRKRPVAADAIDAAVARIEYQLLGSAHMTINKNAIPNDPEKPMVTSGVRIGTPAMTTRGFKDEEARITANLIADVLENPRDAANIDAVRAKVHALTSRFPVYR